MLICVFLRLIPKKCYQSFKQIVKSQSLNFYNFWLLKKEELFTVHLDSQLVAEYLSWLY